MTASPGAEALLADLPRRGFPDAEIFEKSGRSRRFVREFVAIGCSRVFYAATGSADPGAPQPEPSPYPLRLPELTVSPAAQAAGASEPWNAPPEFDAPLATESVAATLLGAIERELRRELPASRLVTAWLEDGASGLRRQFGPQLAAGARAPLTCGSRSRIAAAAAASKARSARPGGSSRAPSHCAWSTGCARSRRAGAGLPGWPRRRWMPIGRCCSPRPSRRGWCRRPASRPR